MNIKIKKNVSIIIIVSIMIVILVGIGLSIGLTYSLWSDTSGGDSTVAPSTITYDWNAYTKYFTYDAHRSDGTIISNGSGVKNGATLSESPSYFVCTGLSKESLLPDIIFPEIIEYKVGDASSYSTAPLREVSNTVFEEITYKQMPTSIVISSNIIKIKQGAFVGLTNLQTVTFYPGNAGLRIGYGVFSGCTSLKTIKSVGNKAIVFTDNSFIGCSVLESFDRDRCSINYINDIDSSNDPVAIDSLSKWEEYKNKIFLGVASGFSLTPSFSS